jgi:phosphoribosylamine---glycine ligase
MNILIIGNGGREHALAWKINQSPLCTNLFIAPGNAGTTRIGINIPIAISEIKKLINFCIEDKIDMVVVGPEDPLVKGIYNEFKNNALTKHIHIIGPSKEAALLEGSKAFAKEFMMRHHIPTAVYKEFNSINYDQGIQYIRNHALPIVLKADGLAAGKGVVICTSHIEALAEFELMIQQAKFGDAGKKVVIEAFLDGIEVSVFVLTDGSKYVLLPEAKDYKRIGRGDTGPNTGGMGAVSPVPFVDDAFRQKIKTQIIEPTIKGLQQEKLEYKGIIFIGIIKVNDEPFVIEYNCRLGDPETEVVIPRIENDLVEMLLATSQQRIHEIDIKIKNEAAVTTVAVSGGYPNEYITGKIIDLANIPVPSDTLVFHAGTIEADGHIVTNGGRVLTVTSFGKNIGEAAAKSIGVLEQIYFDEMYYRSDIGYEFL